jgi:hypothetical protein
MTAIVFEDFDVSLPLVVIRDDLYAVHDIHYSRAKRKSKRTIAPVVYVDVVQAETPVAGKTITGVPSGKP